MINKSNLVCSVFPLYAYLGKIISVVLGVFWACSYRHENPTEFERLSTVAEIFLQNLD